MIKVTNTGEKSEAFVQIYVTSFIITASKIICVD